jgi:hypothetical protein
MSAGSVDRLRLPASACFVIALCTGTIASAQSVPLPPG